MGASATRAASRRLHGGRAHQVRMILQRQLHRERGAVAELRAQLDVPAEQPGELPRQREPEARATVRAAPGTVQLPELLEHHRLRLLGNADARILYGEAHEVVMRLHR